METALISAGALVGSQQSEKGVPAYQEIPRGLWEQAELLGTGSSCFAAAEGTSFSLNPSACPVSHSSILSFLQKQGRREYFPREVSGKAALASSWVWIRPGRAGVREGRGTTTWPGFFLSHSRGLAVVCSPPITVPSSARPHSAPLCPRSRTIPCSSPLFSSHCSFLDNNCRIQMLICKALPSTTLRFQRDAPPSFTEIHVDAQKSSTDSLASGKDKKPGKHYRRGNVEDIYKISYLSQPNYKHDR